MPKDESVFEPTNFDLPYDILEMIEQYGGVVKIRQGRNGKNPSTFVQISKSTIF